MPATKASEPVLLTLDLDTIEVSPECQQRAVLDDKAPLDYAADMKAGDTFPPLVVFQDAKSGDRWLAGGHYRRAAYLAAGVKKVPCLVHDGTLRDAILWSCRENADHGDRRRPEDKRKAVLTLLQDKVWKTWSDHRIAEACKVSHTFVAKLRPPVNGEGADNGQSTGNVASPATKAGVKTTRIGKDGKARPASNGRKGGGKAKPKENPDNDPPPEGEAPPARPEPAGDRDGLGIPVPPALAATFAARDRFAEIRVLLARARRLVSELAMQPGGEHYRKELSYRHADGRDHYDCEHLQNALYRLNYAEPYCAVCPDCHAAGTANPECPACLGTGWVPKRVYVRSLPERRAAVEALAEGGAP